MRLQQLEDRVGEIREVATYLSQHVDGAQANLKSFMNELTCRTIEKFSDVSATCQLGLRCSSAGLSAFRNQFRQASSNPPNAAIAKPRFRMTSDSSTHVFMGR